MANQSLSSELSPSSIQIIEKYALKETGIIESTLKHGRVSRRESIETLN